MPPKGPWLFDDKVDGKVVKYLGDKSHSCAWCKGCINWWVQIHQDADIVDLSSGTIPEVRTHTALVLAGDLLHLISIL